MALVRSHHRLRPGVLPPDELPSASGTSAARSGRDSFGRFARGNTEQRTKLVRPGPRGHAGLAVDPAFAPFERWGRRYASHRRAELAKSHGGTLSAGVSALIESAGGQLAASRYLHAKASGTGDAEGFKRASALANDARQNELAAWELAAREARSRPREALPWLDDAETDEPAPTFDDDAPSAPAPSSAAEETKQ